MISKVQASKKIVEKMPDRKVNRVMDYDSVRWVVEAIPRDGTEVMDPFFSVNKKNGAVGSFYPTEDLDKFFAMLDRNG